MQYKFIDDTYHFVSAFDMDTGAYLRTGILDEMGRDTGQDPFMASFPHLIDVGIMGHCLHGKTGACLEAGIGCYQSGPVVDKPNMLLKDFQWIVQQCKGRCNQIALGGRGDPDQHESFVEVLQSCRENMLVPNFTTSGYGMTPRIASLCKKYCGAVAVSWYGTEYTLNAIDMLLDAGVKTNIHYVLGNNSIDEALKRLRNDEFPPGINAVIFLLHKPTGLGQAANVLSIGDSRVEEFFELFDGLHPFKVGIDSCCVPGAISFCRNIHPESLDTCEGGRFSCYIGSDMTMAPCSFDQNAKYAVKLAGSTGSGLDIEGAWNSAPFERFRYKMRSACPDCSKRELCMGGCPLMQEIVLCDEMQKRLAE